MIARKLKTVISESSQLLFALLIVFTPFDTSAAPSADTQESIAYAPKERMQELEFSVEEGSMAALVEVIRVVSNRNIVCTKLCDRTISYKVRKKPWNQAIFEVAGIAGLKVWWEGNTLVLHNQEQYLPLYINGGETFSGRLVTLDLNEVEFSQFVRVLSKISGNSFVGEVSPHETISIKLREVPWDLALSVVLNELGLGAERRGERIRIYRRND